MNIPTMIAIIFMCIAVDNMWNSKLRNDLKMHNETLTFECTKQETEL